MKTNRRNFLKLGAAAAVAPTLWLPRYAHATPGFGATKHVLVLFAQGGFRSHCTFNAVGEFPKINPFGVHPDVIPGREWVLGGAVGSETFTTSAGTVPSFASVSGDVTVLGCVDHSPLDPVDVNHKTAIRRICTGDPGGTTGLLARIGKDLPLYQNGGFSLSAVPPVEIGPSAFGFGSGDYAPTVPISIASAAAGFEAGPIPIGTGWKIAAREAQDARFLNTSPRNYRPRLGNFIVGKKNAGLFADMLSDPLLAVVDQPAATGLGFTNAQLLQVLGNLDLAVGDDAGKLSWGSDVALALRLLAFGSPMAVVRREMYDMHDQEELNYAPRAKDLVRQFAGLHFLLHAMPHPDGGTFWDHTIVTVVSEFGRNNSNADGFNSGNGSDHVVNDDGPLRNQAIAMMGGPIAASKGRLIGPTDDQIDAGNPSQVFTTGALLNTLADALGINQGYFGTQPISEIYS